MAIVRDESYAMNRFAEGQPVGTVPVEQPELDRLIDALCEIVMRYKAHQDRLFRMEQRLTGPKPQTEGPENPAQLSPSATLPRLKGIISTLHETQAAVDDLLDNLEGTV